MNEPIRGANGRLLARLLDQFDLPTAVLDRRGQIVFVNAALCKMAKMEATSLVGEQCSWQVAPDGANAAVLTALAPPSSALEGRISIRQLTAPIVFGAKETGQLFLPMTDSNGVVQLTAVVLGHFEQILKLLPVERRPSLLKAAPDRVLIQVRSRWKTLDGLLFLVGSSPAMELAMWRSQLSVSHPCNAFLYGPAGIGKLEVAQGIFLSRLKAASVHAAKGQFFPIDCRVLDAELVQSMLEIFAGRLQSDLPRAAQQLVLTGVDRLSPDSLTQVLSWADQYRTLCWISATSSIPATELAARSQAWSKLVSRVASTEIHLPPLAERREDIPPLALQSLAEECKAADRAQLTLAADAHDRLVAYSWPGNVRELRESIHYATTQAVLTSAIQVHHLPVAIRAFPGANVASQTTAMAPIHLDEVLLEVERTLLSRAIKLSPRNRAQAARLLGISRPRLLRRIEQLGLGTDERSTGEAEEE